MQTAPVPTLEYDPNMDPVVLQQKLDFLTEQVRQLHDRILEVDLCITRTQADVADIHRALFESEKLRRHQAKHGNVNVQK